VQTRFKEQKMEQVMTQLTSDTLDRDQISQLKNRYGWIVDRLPHTRTPEDADQIRALFTEDAVVDLSFSGLFDVVQGHDAIVKLYLEAMGPKYHYMWHAFHTPLIDIDGDHAVGSWTLQAITLSKSLEPDAAPSVFHGRYVDSFIRTSQGWRHSHLAAVKIRP
jgi:ketosteroid isomerase-like protein